MVVGTAVFAVIVVGVVMGVTVGGVTEVLMLLLFCYFLVVLERIIVQGVVATMLKLLLL